MTGWLLDVAMSLSRYAGVPLSHALPMEEDDYWVYMTEQLEERGYMPEEHGYMPEEQKTKTTTIMT